MNGSPMVNWTEAKVETLKAMWKEGASVRKIALEITGSERNKNAIISKANRMDIGPHPKARKAPKMTEAQRVERDKGRDLKSAARYQERKAEKKAKPAPEVIIEKIKPIPVINDGNPIDADTRFLKGRAWQPLPDTKPVSLEDLPRKGACRWPVTADSPFLFCAAAAGDATYCSTHKHLSTRRL